MSRHGFERLKKITTLTNDSRLQCSATALLEMHSCYYFLVCAISAVQDPVFEVQSGRIFGIFWIWIGYRFSFNRIWTIQMKYNVAKQKILIWNYSCVRKIYDISKSYY